MAKLCFTTHLQDLGILYPFDTKSILSLTHRTLYFLLLYITHAIPIDLIDTENHLPSDDSIVSNSMVSQTT